MLQYGCATRYDRPPHTSRPRNVVRKLLIPLRTPQFAGLLQQAGVVRELFLRGFGVGADMFLWLTSLGKPMFAAPSPGSVH